MAFRLFSRKFSTSRQLRAIIDEQFTPDKLEAFKSPKVVLGVELWKKLTYWIALPSYLLANIYCICGHLEHKKHEKRPEFVPYSYMRIRTKRFPWRNGDQTLFHSPKLTATSKGYEEDE